MNERDEARGREGRERGRESNGGQDFYPGSHGFDDAHDHIYRGVGRSDSQDRERQDRYGRYDWGPRSSRSERIPWNERARPRESFPRDIYGREHSSEQLFDREPFGHNDDTPRYYGTGAAGFGGPGYTGGAYAYGNGPRDQRRQIEEEFSDESAVSYERGGPAPGYRSREYGYGRPGLDRSGVNVRGQYGAGWPTSGQHVEQRMYPRGPKGYQRSDERLKEDICERLWAAYHIDSSEVSVDVKGGKVSLEGSVPTRHMKHAIEDIVDACPGVTDIDNRVRVGLAVTNPSASPVGNIPTPAKGR